MLNYTDMCTQCNTSLKEQFLDRLRDSLVDFEAHASLAMISEGERRIELMVVVTPSTGSIRYKIFDNYRVVEIATNYLWIIGEYEKYVRENL